MDFRQQHIRDGYDFSVMNAREEAARGGMASFWMGQISALSTWANAAPRWEFVGHQNEIDFLRVDYARRHAA